MVGVIADDRVRKRYTSRFVGFAPRAQNPVSYVDLDYYWVQEREMRRTPNVGSFRTFRPRDCPEQHPGCLESRSAYELPGLEREPKLFSSERMVFRDGREVPEWQFGDWDCDVLFLMQDAAPWSAIQERIGWHPDPFSQRNYIEEPRAGGAATNRELVRFARHLSCRKLAGNVLIGILKPAEGYQRRIDDLAACPWIREYCLRVIRWVLDAGQTRNLKLVACLGRPAFDFVGEALGLPEATKAALDAKRGSTATVGRLRMAYVWHPQPQAWARVGRPAAEEAWRRMASESGIPFVD